MKTTGPGDPASQSAFAAVSSEFCIQNNFKIVDWDGPVSQTIPAKISDKPYIFPSHQDETQLALPRLDHYPIFPTVP